MTVDLRRKVLDESLKVIATEGVGALSLRDIARRARVTHGAPYHYFRDKAEVLEVLSEEGFGLLRDAMRAAAAGLDDAGERLAAIGQAYVGFAVEHPGYFQVMFRPGGRPLRRGAAGEEAFAVLVEAIRAAQREGAAPKGDEETLVLLAWSAVHGLASLWVDGALQRTDAARVGVATLASRQAQELTRLYASAARRK